MKKIDKKDVLSCVLLTVFFLVFVFVITRFKFYYGSTLDWEPQHATIPEYFRLLFYKTHSILPDFAFNLGSGQNIYNFSYYGLLSPLILVSFIFPFVEMADYISVTSIISVVCSAILFYLWLRRNWNGKYISSFLASFALLFATSMSFHSHRHIMFINYMPFLILGLYGVDKKLCKNKSFLLIISVFLMVMTSYYYSISGIMCLVIYAVYKYLVLHKKILFKDFIKDGLKLVLPIFIGILCSAVVIVPTFYVILNGRGETFNSIKFSDLFIPGINLKYVLYGSYGIGLTSILVLSIIHLLLKKREDKFLGVMLSLLVLFPFINYILNATMYIDAKILIPLLPLAVFAINIFIKDVFNDKVDFRKLYIVILILSVFVIFKGNIALAFFVDLGILSLSLFLYKRLQTEIFLIIPCVFIPFSASLIASSSDTLVDYQVRKDKVSTSGSIINSITSQDEGIYRINNLIDSGTNMNNLYGNINYYNSTIYSSTYNRGYNNFYYDVINNPIQSRNRVITSSTTNLMYLLFSGSKYLISNSKPYHGYEYFNNINGVNVYKNDNVLPLIYARSEVMSKKEFLELGYPYNSEALLKKVIVDTEERSNFDAHVKKVELDLKKIKLENLELSEKSNYYEIKARDNAYGILSLLDELKNKVIFVRFNMVESPSCKNGDLYIKINDAKNKLTCKSWKYHNQNYTYDYILGMENLDKLKIEFSKGVHKINNIEIYSLDYEYLDDIKNNIDEFKFDKDKTKGDFIVGDIDVEKNGYLVTSIPYDKGFVVEVDNSRVDYLNVNEGFLGVKIEKGKHHVSIEYKAPFKDAGIIISLVGMLLCISLIISENRELLKKK